MNEGVNRLKSLFSTKSSLQNPQRKLATRKRTKKVPESWHENCFPENDFRENYQKPSKTTFKELTPSLQHF